MSEDIMSAWNIEFAFKSLVGLDSDALEYLSADVFRSGDTTQIGILLQKSADVLMDRMGNIEFEAWENVPGQPRVKLGRSINHLRLIGHAMEKLNKHERDD